MQYNIFNQFLIFLIKSLFEIKISIEIGYNNSNNITTLVKSYFKLKKNSE